MLNHARMLRRRAFTLIEIMVVVVVLGILAAVIIPNLVGGDEEARVSKARADITTMVTLLEKFRFDMGRYPEAEEGLDILRNPPSGDDASRWKGPYTRSPIPKDPWGEPYVYSAPAPNGIDPYGIESYGSDKQPGGEGTAKDINSWSNYEDTETVEE